MTRKEYQNLCREINQHMEAYYNDDAPTISDYEYDQLMQKLKGCEREHPEWVTPSSPSQRIGGTAQTKAGAKVHHNVPMLSIEDVFNKEDVEHWVNGVKKLYPDCRFSVETKIDGLSMTVRYNKGKDGRLHFVLAETRGDGFMGEDVTANALVIDDVPKILDIPFDYLELRGEVYMPHASFNSYNQEQEERGLRTAANPRNLAAGTLRQLDPSIVEKRKLGMFIFNVQDGPDDVFFSHTDNLDYLARHGVPVVKHFECGTIAEIFEAIDSIANMRSDLPYDIDGAVVKIDDIKLRDYFPAGSKYSAGHIAYKYPPEDAIVVMDDIEVGVGRTGKLTYTGVFHDKNTGRPAVLCGTNVSRVTLHNQNYISNMEVGIGGHYSLVKSGEIIPKLKDCVYPPKHVFRSPERCPVCGSLLEIDEDSADIFCINPSCPAQLLRTISYFASSGCMDIDGLGEIVCEKLINAGYLRDYADIYLLKNYRDELIRSNIIGRQRSVDGLLEAIEQSKNNEPERLLTGLGIRNVGRATAKEIMRHYSSIKDLIGVEMGELSEIDGVGHITENYICSFFGMPENQEILRSLERSGVNMQMKEKVSGKLNDISFAITGILKQMTRKEAIDLIEKNGGTYTRTVNHATNYILVGVSPGSKLDEANELGVSTISEEQFLEMVI